MNLLFEPQQQTGSEIVTEDSDHCLTPGWLFQALDHEFAFDLDPCPLARFPEKDGLALDWNGKRVFCNSPYSNIKPWVAKALTSDALVVFLVPARFDARWCLMLRDAQAEFRFFAKGFSFTKIDGGSAHPKSGAMIVIVKRLYLPNR